MIQTGFHNPNSLSGFPVLFIERFEYDKTTKIFVGRLESIRDYSSGSLLKTYYPKIAIYNMSTYRECMFNYQYHEEVGKIGRISAHPTNMDYVTEIWYRSIAINHFSDNFKTYLLGQDKEEHLWMKLILK